MLPAVECNFLVAAVRLIVIAPRLLSKQFYSSPRKQKKNLRMPAQVSAIAFSFLLVPDQGGGSVTHHGFGAKTFLRMGLLNEARKIIPSH